MMRGDRKTVATPSRVSYEAAVHPDYSGVMPRSLKGVG